MASAVAGLPSWLSDRHNLALAAVALLPAALVVVASRDGPGVTADSVGYVAAARHFAAGGEFRYWDGTPFTTWPPGLPLILGTLIKVGVDPLVSTLVLNVLSAITLVALTYLIGRRLLSFPNIGLVPAALVAIALPTVRVHSQLWTEPLFTVLCLATIWLLMRMIQNGTSTSGVIAVAACVSMACSLRYIGIALLPVVGVSLLTGEARRGLPQALGRAAAVVALSGIGIAVLALRNLTLVGSLLGSSSRSSASLRPLIRTTLANLGGWIAADARVGTTVAVFVGAAILGMAIVGVFFLARNVALWRVAVPLVAFIASYLIVLVISLLSVNALLDFRYLAPLLPPMAILVVVAVSSLWSLATRPMPRADGNQPSRVRRLASVVLGATSIVVVGVYLAANASGSVSFALRMGRSGGGYNSDQKLESPLARAAGSVPGTPGLLTNDPQRVYWITGRDPILGRAALAKSGNPAETVRAGIEAGTLTHFAEFNDSRTTQGVSKNELAAWGVVLVDPLNYPEGILYRMTIGPPQ